MIDWNNNLDPAKLSIGDELPAIEIPMTLQRLVMEAGANYDLSLMHHDKRAADSVGSPDAFANTFFLMGMYERLLREWAGTQMRLKRIGQLKMIKFNVVDDLVTFSGVVKEISGNIITVDLQSSVDDVNTSTAFAIIELRDL